MFAQFGNQILSTETTHAGINVERSKCVRHRCSANECNRCIDVCPVDSISWKDRNLRIDSTDCTECQLCLSVCPTAAISANDLSLSQLLSELAKHELPVLGCKGKPETDAHERLSCLGYLANNEFMVLLALVFKNGLQINLSACSGCLNNHILDSLILAHAQLNKLLPGHSINLIRSTRELRYLPSTISRRHFLTFARDRFVNTTSTLVEKINSSSEIHSYGNKRLPEIRRLLLKVLDTLPKTLSNRIINQLFGKMVFTSNCNYSKRCIGTCPTGAIRASKKGNKQPLFDQNLCVSCESCQAFCSNQGVITPSVT